jgi:transcriptional regulator with XRE-family HTH domain
MRLSDADFIAFCSQLAAAATAEELKAARLALGLSQEGFAKILQVAGRQAVWRLEHDKRQISGPVAAFVELLLKSPAARDRAGRGG